MLQGCYVERDGDNRISSSPAHYTSDIRTRWAQSSYPTPLVIQVAKTDCNLYPGGKWGAYPCFQNTFWDSRRGPQVQTGKVMSWQRERFSWKWFSAKHRMWGKKLTLTTPRAKLGSYTWTQFVTQDLRRNNFMINRLSARPFYMHDLI